MLQRNLSDDRSTGLSWEDTGAGAPTIIGFARLCSNALASGHVSTDGLSVEAIALLYAARERGVIEIKASNNAFDAIDRFLAVYVEIDPDTGFVFKRKDDPTRTIRFLDAFRELCAAGLVYHHLYREFSLTSDGFQFAAKIAREDIEDALSFASKLERHEW